MSTPDLATRAPSPPAGAHDQKLRLPLLALEGFVALGAIYGGVEMLRDPLTPMGATTELIQGSPFETFTWPGVLLLTLLGFTPLALAVGVVARVRGAVTVSGAFGVGLMAWICVQWILLPGQLWLQPLMFGIGLVVVVLSALLHRAGAR